MKWPAPGADATASTPEITPEERKKAKKVAKKGRQKAADARRKEKKALTKSVENMGLNKAAAARADTPAGRSSISAKSGKTNRTDSSERVAKPEKPAKPLYKEISRFTITMADSIWLLTIPYCKSDPHPSKEQVIKT